MDGEFRYVNSTGVKVGDGLRPTRISEGGKKFEILVDEKTERYSEVFYKVDDTPPAPELASILVATSSQLSAALEDAEPGQTFVLEPGVYHIQFDPRKGFKFLPADGHDFEGVGNG